MNLEKTELTAVSKEKLELITKIEEKLLSQDFDLNTFMQTVVTEMQNLTPATGVVIELAEGDKMVYRAASGTVAESLGLSLEREKSISGLCVSLRQTLKSDDTENDPRVNKEAARKVQARSLVVAPLFQADNAVGVLKILSNKPNAFTEADVKLLQLIAGFLGSALQRQIINEIKAFF